MNYAEQLRHPKWQKKRLEVLQEAEFTCQCCGDSDSPLHVHHRRYVKGRMPWEYGGNELVVVCGSCHGVEHEARKLVLEALLLAIPGAIDEARIAALIAGYLSVANPPLQNAVPSKDLLEACEIEKHAYSAGIAAARMEIEELRRGINGAD